MITLEDAKAMYKKWEGAELSEIRAAMLPKMKKEYIYAMIRGIELDRLEAICDAERDGRCVVLPCKPNERWIGEQGEIVVIKIVTDWTGTYVHYRYKGKREVCCCNPTYFAIHFTREEAEVALRKEQGDER